MSTRGTLHIIGPGDSRYFYISHSAGEFSEMTLKTLVRWANNRSKLPTTEQLVSHLKTLKGGGLFEPSPTGHPFADAAYSNEADRKIFGGGASSPFNEYEYTVEFYGRREAGGDAGWALHIETGAELRAEN